MHITSLMSIIVHGFIFECTVSWSWT